MIKLVVTLNSGIRDHKIYFMSIQYDNQKETFCFRNSKYDGCKESLFSIPIEKINILCLYVLNNCDRYGKSMMVTLNEKFEIDLDTNQSFDVNIEYSYCSDNEYIMSISGHWFSSSSWKNSEFDYYRIGKELPINKLEKIYEFVIRKGGYGVVVLDKNFNII